MEFIGTLLFCRFWEVKVGFRVQALGIWSLGLRVWEGLYVYMLRVVLRSFMGLL